MGVYNSSEIQTIIDTYGDAVYRMALIQGKNTEAADAIYQNVFLKLIRRKEQIPFGESVRRWLLKETIKCDMHRSGYHSAGPVTECVQKLTKKGRVVFHLCFYEGYRNSEIEEFAGIKEHIAAESLEKSLEKMPQILELERVRECESYIERYKEEMNAMRHNTRLDEKILRLADKPIRKLTFKKISFTIMTAMVIGYCVYWLWDVCINMYHMDESIPYFMNSVNKTKITLDETTVIDIDLNKYIARRGSSGWSEYNSNRFETYQEFSEFMNLELFGSDNIDYTEDIYTTIRKRSNPVAKKDPLYQLWKYGEISTLIKFEDETYYLEVLFKVKGYTEKNEVLKVRNKKANYAYEYRRGKYAYFIYQGMGASNLVQNIYFVENGMLYCICNVPVTLEANEKIMKLLDAMAGNEE